MTSNWYKKTDGQLESFFNTFINEHLIHEQAPGKDYDVFVIKQDYNELIEYYSDLSPPTEEDDMDMTGPPPCSSASNSLVTW